MELARRPILVLIVFWTLGAGCRGGSQKVGPDSGLVVVQRPELLMSQMKIQSYGPLGLDWEMTAPHADGATTKNLMHADNIQIVFFQDGKKTTDLTAREGVIRFENKSEVSASSEAINQAHNLDPGDIYLTGDVVAVSTDGSHLTTDWLWFDKSKNIIFSTAPVKIVRDDSVTKGVGLEATSNLSNVKIFKQTLTIKEKSKKK